MDGKPRPSVPELACLSGKLTARSTLDQRSVGDPAAIPFNPAPGNGNTRGSKGALFARHHAPIIARRGDDEGPLQVLAPDCGVRQYTRMSRNCDSSDLDVRRPSAGLGGRPYRPGESRVKIKPGCFLNLGRRVLTWIGFFLAARTSGCLQSGPQSALHTSSELLR
jgi:hypothetical protein